MSKRRRKAQEEGYTEVTLLERVKINMASQ